MCIEILIQVRYDTFIFWQNLSSICKKYPKSLNNLNELILIVEEARPLSDNETPLINPISVNVHCRKFPDESKEEIEKHRTFVKKLRKCIAKVGRKMINLETCIVDIGKFNHHIFDGLLGNVSKGQSSQSVNRVHKGVGLKYLYLMNLMQSSLRLASCVFQNLQCLVIESLWKSSHLDVCSFFSMIDQCRRNVESSRGGTPKLFIKLHCYVQYSLVVQEVTDAKPTCNIWKDWFFNGLIDFSVDCRSVTLSEVDSSIPNAARRFERLVPTADYFGNVLNGFRDKSGWAARLKERVFKDCQLNQTCVILPQLDRHETIKSKSHQMVIFNTNFNRYPIKIQNALWNPKLEHQMMNKMIA